jgi:nitrite reductase/ring-hydroxylating ferredoxin subunit
VRRAVVRIEAVACECCGKQFNRRTGNVVYGHPPNQCVTCSTGVSGPGPDIFSDMVAAAVVLRELLLVGPPMT